MNPLNTPPNLHAGFQKKVAYFSMEFAIHQPLKIYAGGLGYLAGSHMRSAYELGQNMTGIGILWKYGYYDQVRKGDQTMEVLFQEKVYGFLKKTDIKFTIEINQTPVYITAYYLPPEVFKTAPIYFLTTDLPENDYLAQTTCHKLYDGNPSAKLAAGIVLGRGGGKLLDLLNLSPEVYHLNEAHALPLAFYLYEKHKSLDEVRKRLVFTNHTPEEAGNQKTELSLLKDMSYLGTTPPEVLQEITKNYGNVFDHTKAALHFAGISNGVSRLHGTLLAQYWQTFPQASPIISITNAQNKQYWQDEALQEHLNKNNLESLLARKKSLKKLLFEEVADQTGEIYDEHIFTLVWARRFAGYKRPELLLLNHERFHKLLLNNEYPVQIIWAGKPYPMDYTAIAIFDRIAHEAKKYPNCAILTAYELKLSKMLKQGADVWLNTPRLQHEASGTSGMTAAMNGAINVSTADGWFPEFCKHGTNSFEITPTETQLPIHEQDLLDNQKLLDMLEFEILPLYHNRPDKWIQLMKNSMQDVLPTFDSNRMATEYYERLYRS